MIGLAVLFAATAEAQKPPIKFGDVPIEQLKMKRYEKDTSASAVVLADYGESMMMDTLAICHHGKNLGSGIRS